MKVVVMLDTESDMIRYTTEFVGEESHKLDEDDKLELEEMVKTRLMNMRRVVRKRVHQKMSRVRPGSRNGTILHKELYSDVERVIRESPVPVTVSQIVTALGDPVRSYNTVKNYARHLVESGDVEAVAYKHMTLYRARCEGGV